MIAEFICGDDQAVAPIYRSSSKLTRFFHDAGLPRFVHDGSTRKWWVLDALKSSTPDELRQVICRLASPREYRGDADATRRAIEHLNHVLQLEGLRVELRGAQPIVVPIPIQFDLAPKNAPRELRPLPPPDFRALGLEPALAQLLKQRWDEAQICVEHKAHLMATVAMGGLLEGLLLATMLSYPANANRSSSAPKDSSGKVKPFHEWTLSEMIDVAHALGWIDLDVKEFSHSVRRFRNLIHPYEQLATKANPDEDTCGISWLVVQAAVNDLARTLKPKKQTA